MQPAQRFEPAEDVVHDRTAVECLAALPADAAQRGGERRVRHLFPGGRRPPAGEEQSRGDRIPQFFPTAVPIGGDARRHDVTLFGRARRRLEQFGQRPRAVLAVEGAPGVNRTRHGHGMRRRHSNFADSVLDIPIDGGFCRCPSRAVEGNGQRPLARIQNETVAADSGALRLGDALHRDRRDRGVGGVAAGTQHVERGECGSGVRGCSHPVRRHRRRSPRNIEVAHRLFLDRTAHPPTQPSPAALAFAWD